MSSDSDYQPSSSSSSCSEQPPTHREVVDELTELIVDTLDEYGYEMHDDADGDDLRDEMDVLVNHYFYCSNN